MPPTSIKAFTVLLVAQSFSIFGTSLTGFALGVWVYNEVGSATIYSLIALANGIPIVLFSPLAGAIVDRVNRKKIILAAQLAACLITATLMLLYSVDALRPWHIIALVALNSVFLAFVLPTIAATVPLMVPKDQLTRANGMIALAFGIIQLTGPAIAGTLYTSVGLKTIFLLDLVTFAVGMTAVLLTTIPQPIAQETASHHEQSIGQSLLAGLTFVTGNRSLTWILVFYALMVSTLMTMGIMVQPMVLAFTDARTLGFIMSFSACGILFGSTLMIVLRHVNRHIPIILAATFTVGFFCIITPAATTPWLLAAGGFMIMSCFPVFDANNRALIQRKVDPLMLGRVMGLRNFGLGIGKSLMLLSAGPVADLWFEPAMAEGGWLAGPLGPLYGNGQGRGIAVLISLLGLIALVLGLSALLNPRIRQLDTLMADFEQAPDAPASIRH